MNFNNVQFAGNLTADAELRYTAGGTPVCSFDLAVNTPVKINDEWKNQAMFLEITVWGEQGEKIGKSGKFLKGSNVFVQGKLQERKWEYQGKEHRKLTVTAALGGVKFIAHSKGEGSGVHEGVDDQSESQPF